MLTKLTTRSRSRVRLNVLFVACVTASGSLLSCSGKSTSSRSEDESDGEYNTETKTNSSNDLEQLSAPQPLSGAFLTTSIKRASDTQATVFADLVRKKGAELERVLPLIAGLSELRWALTLDGKPYEPQGMGLADRLADEVARGKSWTITITAGQKLPVPAVSLSMVFPDRVVEYKSKSSPASESPTRDPGSSDPHTFFVTGSTFVGLQHFSSANELATNLDSFHCPTTKAKISSISATNKRFVADITNQFKSI